MRHLFHTIDSGARATAPRRDAASSSGALLDWLVRTVLLLPAGPSGSGLLDPQETPSQRQQQEGGRRHPRQEGNRVHAEAWTLTKPTQPSGSICLADTVSLVRVPWARATLQDFADVKYGSNRAQQGLILTMDRSVGNLLEQTPPFLLALWLHALTVSPHAAAWYGWLWLLLRASYPIAFAFPSMSPAMWGVQRLVGISWVSFVTWPSYFVVWMMLYRSSKACGIL
jgi:hypothetical protein